MALPETDTGLDDELTVLAGLPRPELVVRWQDLHGADPPKGISRRLLVLAVAYELQAGRHGGLKPATTRRLRKIAGARSGGSDAHLQPRPQLQPGTRLIREWNGVSHVVEVADGGFIWNGQRHRSLSAIARAITGARWSGPRFFGVTPGGAP